MTESPTFLTEQVFPTLLPIKITDYASAIINEERLEIITDDWNYSFVLKVTQENAATVDLIDDAKFSTYFTSTKFFLEWNIKTGNWVIIGEEVTYIAGNADDKKNEGKYFAFSSPISLVTKPVKSGVNYD